MSTVSLANNKVPLLSNLCVIHGRIKECSERDPQIQWLHALKSIFSGYCKTLDVRMPFISRVEQKSAKLTGANADIIPTSIPKVRCVGNERYKLAKIKGAKIISHVKSPTLRAVKLEGFTVFLDVLPASLSICTHTKRHR